MRARAPSSLVGFSFFFHHLFFSHLHFSQLTVFYNYKNFFRFDSVGFMF